MFVHISATRFDYRGTFGFQFLMQRIKRIALPA